MELKGFDTQLINWENLKSAETPGVRGKNTAKETNFGGYRIRLAEYSSNYETAEWCDKGHIIHCIDGELTLHFKSGKTILLTGGNSLVIADGDAHKAETGSLPARLFIID